MHENKRIILVDLPEGNRPGNLFQEETQARPPKRFLGAYLKRKESQNGARGLSLDSVDHLW